MVDDWQAVPDVGLIDAIALQRLKKSGGTVAGLNGRTAAVLRGEESGERVALTVRSRLRLRQVRTGSLIHSAATTARALHPSARGNEVIVVNVESIIRGVI